MLKLFLTQGLVIIHAGLRPVIYPLCLSLLSAGITGVHHHTGPHQPPFMPSWMCVYGFFHDFVYIYIYIYILFFAP
jgi:hypothetical protein